MIYGGGGVVRMVCVPLNTRSQVMLCSTMWEYDLWGEGRREQSGPNNKQQSTTHGNAPKGSGSYLRPKTHIQPHIHNISVQAHKPLQIIKALTATGWGKQKETLMATYKAVMRPALEYASAVWSPIASIASIAERSIENCHRMHTRHKHTTSA